MGISGISGSIAGAKAAQTQTEVAYAVQAKANSVQKQQGQAAIELIQSAIENIPTSHGGKIDITV